jgi:hypothetical protein
MSYSLVKYDNKYELESYEVLFIEHFKETHSLSKSLALLTKKQQERVNATLRTGKSDLAKSFKDFVEEAPVHPEANKVVILDNLIWMMNQAKEDQDTNGVLRAITEINKMIKGNLVNSTEKKIIERQIVGIVDLTKNNRSEQYQITNDITYEEVN